MKASKKPDKLKSVRGLIPLMEGKYTVAAGDLKINKELTGKTKRAKVKPVKFWANRRKEPKMEKIKTINISAQKFVSALGLATASLYAVNQRYEGDFVILGGACILVITALKTLQSK